MEAERERFRSFRQALSKEDQEAFDRLFDRAKMHTSAGVYMSNPWPMDTILMSICLEHGKMIEEILGLLPIFLGCGIVSGSGKEYCSKTC